jgi:hypothetical protein
VRIRIAAAALAASLGLALPAQAREKVVKSLAVGKDGVRFEVLCESRKKGLPSLSVRAVGKGAPAEKVVLTDDSICRGNPNFSLEYSAREFRLSPTLAGALIREETGGESIAHSYWLVAIVDGKLTNLWSTVYSTQEVVGIDSYRLKTTDSDRNGRQEIDYLAPFPLSNNLEFIENLMSTREAGPDVWEHHILEYNDDKKAMVDRPHEEFGAVLISSKSLHDALDLKVKLLQNRKCEAQDFLVLDTEHLPKLHKGFFVVAGIADSRAEAQAKLDRIKSCRPDISGAIRQVR